MSCWRTSHATVDRSQRAPCDLHPGYQRGVSPHEGEASVIERLAAIAPADIAIPQPVLAEIAFGLERLPRSKRRAALQARFDLVCAEIPRAEWTDEVSQAYGRVKAALERRGTRIEDFDAAIAAHALAAHATLVTANLDHMRRVPGLSVEDWSAGP